MSQSQIPLFYVNQYATNIQLLLQQKGSRLRQCVMSGSHVGAQASPVDQLGAITANIVTGRFNPMPRTDIPTARRWAVPQDYDVNQLLDSFDQLRLVVDPKAGMVQSAVYALGRQIDQNIIQNYFGTNLTGNAGGTSTTFGGFSVSVQQGATAPNNLTVAKLREAKRMLMANNLDLQAEELWCVINSRAHDSLLAETQVINMDFNDKPVLVEGMVHRFLGINFVHTELLPSGTDDQSGTSTQVPLFAKSGVYLGVWGDVRTEIDRRVDLQSIPWQAYAKVTVGATRLEEKKCTYIWCR